MNKEKFDPGIYNAISLDELVTYCVYTLQEEKHDVTFEDMVAKCFEYFPERFSLLGYPQWPDSARVDKSWLRCRTDFKYIKGSVKKGFQITSKGLGIVEKVQNALSTPRNEKITLIKKKAKERTREEMFINNLKSSDAYKLYLSQGDKVDISHYDFCNMLFGTIESSITTLNENLNMLKEYATKLGDKDILIFLEKAESNHPHYLTSKKDTKKKYSGGMNKKKSRRR